MSIVFSTKKKLQHYVHDGVWKPNVTIIKAWTPMNNNWSWKHNFYYCFDLKNWSRSPNLAWNLEPMWHSRVQSFKDLTAAPKKKPTFHHKNISHLSIRKQQNLKKYDSVHTCVNHLKSGFDWHHCNNSTYSSLLLHFRCPLSLN